MLRITISTCAVAMVMTGLSSAQGQADPVNRDAEMLQLSLQAYDMLFKQAGGQDELTSSDVELLATWSRRIIGMRFANTEFWQFQKEVQGIPPGVGESARILVDSLQAHIDRMKALERLAQAQVAAGNAGKLTALTARFHRLDAESLSEKILKMRERAEGELQIELPEPARVPMADTKHDLVVDVDSKDQMKIEGRAVTMKQLSQHIKAAKPPIKSVLIRANAELRHADLIKIVDLFGALEDVSLSIAVQ